MIGGLILAAGAATRFGSPKLVAAFRGAPLLQRAVDAMRAVDAIERFVIVVGSDAERVVGAIDAREAEIVVCDRWADGMSASLSAGLAVVNDFDWVIVTLGDQPFVGAAAIAAVAQSAERTGDHVMAVRARYGGRPGHPVALRSQLFPELARMRGDIGARELLKRVVVEEIEADGLGSVADVDTIADLEALN
jgi:molybdenum cofactor cytidylyltransferase